MGIQMAWDDARRSLALDLAAGSRMLPPLRRNIVIALGPSTRTVTFEGNPIKVSF
jgi:hypothetical protein